MNVMRLFVSVSSVRDWKPQFGNSLLALSHRVTSKGVKGQKLEGFMIRAQMQASCLSGSRQKSLDLAIEGGFTHWLSLDDDMVFPADIVDRLAVHGKDVMTANYCRKVPGKIEGVYQDLKGEIIDSGRRTGIEQIAWMGGGMFLADLSKIKPIPKPHFEVVWSEEKQDYFDQDMVFSGKIRHHGVEIWCDHEASKTIGHVGDYEFRFKDYRWDGQVQDSAELAA